MAADMQRKTSSEGPDGTLAPSDGQSVERAESPTPGLAQGMEPGTRGVCRAVSQGSLQDRRGVPNHSLPPAHARMCSAAHRLFVRCCGTAGNGAEPASSFPGPSPWPARPELSGCQPGPSSWALHVQCPCLAPPRSAVSRRVTSSRVRPALTKLCAEQWLSCSFILFSYVCVACLAYPQTVGSLSTEQLYPCVHSVWPSAGPIIETQNISVELFY